MRRLAYCSVAAILLVGVLAPLLANDVPLIASVNGEMRFPALASYAGEVEPGPEGRTWKEWWLELPEEADDWAVMPPIVHDPFEPDPDRIARGPSLEAPLGNDDTGRDQLARLIWGAGTACEVALWTVAIALAVGIVLGGLAGLFGGWVDFAVSRTIEVFLCFPALIAVLAVAAFFGGSMTAAVCVLAGVYWTAFARVVRGEFLSLREREFVQAARGLGVRWPRLLLRHMMPCVWGPVLVTGAFVAADAIVVESSLSYLGLGQRNVSWGTMLAQGKANAATGAWHLWVFPAAAIALTVLGLHGIADDMGRRRARS